MIKKLLFQAAKKPFMGQIVGNALQYCGWAIPVKKIYSSKEIIAFYHPQPSYENHIVISPKKAVMNLQQMSSERYGMYFMKIWETAGAIRATHPEYHDSFVMVANGGKRQEVQQVHFHMFTHHELVNEYSAQEQADRVFYSDGHIDVLEHPHPNWEIHFVMKPTSSSRMPGTEESPYAYFRSILLSIDVLNREFNIVQRGYSLVYQHSKQKSDSSYPVFHIVSGKKLK